MESRQPYPPGYSRIAELLLFAALTLSACAYPTERPGFEGPEGVPQVLATEPEDGASDVRGLEQLAVLWDRHLDPFAGPSGQALRLSSEAGELSLELHYDLMGRSLVARPTSPLSPGTTYDLEIVDPASLPDFAGRVPETGVLARFSIGDWTLSADPEPSLETLARAAEQSLDSLGCTGCHFEGYLPPDLTRLEQLVGMESRAAAQRVLVVPGAPERSYIMHKLVGDFPDRVGSVMPPSASQDEQSSNESQLRAISDWIAALRPTAP